jgi:hypothetical protein
MGDLICELGHIFPNLNAARDHLDILGRPAGSCGMNLYLRKVVDPQVQDNYRVVLKLEEGEFEIGSIGIQHGAAWRWGIDTVIPMRTHETQGKGKNRMKQFKAAWERLAADETNLTEFLNAKRKRRR